MLPTALSLVCRSVRFITTFDIKKLENTNVSTQQKSMDKTFYYITGLIFVLQLNLITFV